MTLIVTTSAGTSTAYSNQRKLDRTSNGVLWAVFPITNLQSWYSLDDGATWTQGAEVMNYNGSTYLSSPSFFIDQDDYAHVVYKDRVDGYLYYKRGTPNAARTAYTWSAATQVGNSNVYDYPDVVAHREGTGWTVHVVMTATGSQGTKLYSNKVVVSSSGTITADSAAPVARSTAVTANSSAGYPSIDFNHTGDGKTVAGGTPHLYVAWSNGNTGVGYGIRFKKATYSAGSWTWGTEREIDNGHYIDSDFRWLNCLFDGTRVILPGFGWTGAVTDVFLHERDAADTATVTRTLLSGINAAGTEADRPNAGSATYDSAGNVYFGGTTGLVNSVSTAYLRKWNRASSTLAASASFDTSAPERAYVALKRGYSNGRIEYLYTDSSPSQAVVSGALVLNRLPLAPTITDIDWENAQLAVYYNHNDPDGDPQAKRQFRYRKAVV